MRLIDADALQKEYMYEHDGKRLMLIDVAHTIEERKTGKWLETNVFQRWKCSECGEITMDAVMGEPRANYCPNCGADMRGDKDDQR